MNLIITGDIMNDYKNSAIRIIARKKLNKTKLIDPDLNSKKEESSDESFRKKGDYYVSLSHFSDFIIQESDQSKSLLDMFSEIPIKQQHGYFYNFKYIFLGKQLKFWGVNVKSKFVEHKQLNKNTSKLIIVTGIKFIDHSSETSLSSKIKLIKEAINKFETFSPDVTIEVREGLGFVDIGLLICADDISDIFKILSSLTIAQISKKLNGITFMYSIFGTKEDNYNNLIDKLNSEDNSDINSMFLTSIQPDFPSSNFVDKQWFLTLGSYDLGLYNQIPHLEDLCQYGNSHTFLFSQFNFDQLNHDYEIAIQAEEKSKQSENKSNQNEDKSNQNEDKSNQNNSVITYAEKTMKLWDDFNKLNSLTQDINEQLQNNSSGKYPHSILSIHQLNLLEKNIIFLSNVMVQKPINDLLIDEWLSILSQFLFFSIEILKEIDKIISSSENNLEELSELNISLSNNFHETLGYIQTISNHWLIGSKFQLEQLINNNVFHYGAASNIYSMYTKLFDTIEKFFQASSPKNKEKVNFFIVPTYSNQTKSKLLFDNFDASDPRLIAIKVPPPILFDFSKIGLIFHEMGHYISCNRSIRNEALLKIFIDSLASDILTHFISVKNYETTINKYIKNSFYDTQHFEFFDIIDQYLKNKFVDKIAKILNDEIRHELEEYEIRRKNSKTPLVYPNSFDEPIDIFMQRVKDLLINDNPPQNPESDNSAFIAEEKWIKISKKLSKVISNISAEEKNVFNNLTDFMRINYQNKNSFSNKLFHEYSHEISKYFLDIELAIKDIMGPEYDDVDSFVKDVFIPNLESILPKIESMFPNFESMLPNIESLDPSIYVIFRDHFLYNIRKTALKYLSNKSENLSYNKRIENQIYSYIYFRIIANYDILWNDLQNTQRVFEKKFINMNLLYDNKESLSYIETELSLLLLGKKRFNNNNPEYKKKKVIEYFSNFSMQIKETKADYFMVKSLGLTEEVYRDLYNLNLNPDLDLIDNKEQLDKRIYALKLIGAFDEKSMGDKNSRKIESIIAFSVYDSLSDEIKTFCKQDQIAECRRLLQKENLTISDELQFINTIMNSEGWKGDKNA